MKRRIFLLFLGAPLIVGHPHVSAASKAKRPSVKKAAPSKAASTSSVPAALQATTIASTIVLSTAVTTTTPLLTTTTTAPASPCVAAGFPAPKLPSLAQFNWKTTRFDLDGWAMSQSPARIPLFFTFAARDLSFSSEKVPAGKVTFVVPGTAKGVMTAKRFILSGGVCSEVGSETFDVALNPLVSRSEFVIDVGLSKFATKPLSLAGIYLDPATKASDVFNFMGPSLRIPQLDGERPWPTLSAEHQIAVRVSDGSSPQAQLTGPVKGDIDVTTGAIGVNAAAGTGSVDGTGVTKLLFRISAYPQ
jgi:hypothetical protein